MARLKNERARWWASFGLLAVLGLAWAISTPVFAAPDEPAHVIRAASAGRGELLGRELRKRPPAPFADVLLVVSAPGIYENSAEVNCFAFHSNHPAGCLHLHGPDHDVHMTTYVGHHPPAYYAAVGFLSRLVEPGDSQVIVMRALGVLAVAALLASCLTTLRRTAAPMWAGAGFAVALTPMVLFLSSVVSPSGIEIAAAIGVWVHGAALASDGGNPDAAIDPRLIDRLGIAASVLVISRGLSPLWLAVIGAVLLLLTTRARLSIVLQARRLWIWGGVVGVGLALQAVWFVYGQPLGHFVGWPLREPASAIVRMSFGKTPQLLEEMVGIFGWLDTRSPGFNYVVWALAIGALVGLTLAVATGRFVRALVAATAATLILPVILESVGAGTAGLIWQGRYTLPLAVGIPLLAGLGIGSNPAQSPVGRRLPVILVGSLALAQVAAFVQTLRRYSVGLKGVLWFFPEAHWEPPIPALVLIVVFALAVVTALWWIVLAPRPVATDGTELVNDPPADAR